MALILNEEQQMIRQAAREFFQANAPVSQLRALRDSRDPLGYEPSLWQSMMDMGWHAMLIPEQYGGLGMGLSEMGQVLEESGRTLTSSPLLTTGVLGVSSIVFCHNEQLKSEILPAIADGSVSIALAHEETHTHKSVPESVMAEIDGQAFRLTGKKKFVVDGTNANRLIVTAKEGHRTALFLVPSSAKGVTMTKRIMMDSRYAAEISFDRVLVEPELRLDQGERGQDLLEKILDTGRIALSAELLGIGQEAYDRTLAYLKERKQFGVPIGSFQGLQHRAAHLFCELELCKSLIIKTLNAFDEGKDIRVLASMTKSKLSEVVQHTTNEAIQMFGGIGMTDDEEIGFFMKRARVAQQMFGDANFHIHRFASLKGF